MAQKRLLGSFLFTEYRKTFTPAVIKAAAMVSPLSHLNFLSIYRKL